MAGSASVQEEAAVYWEATRGGNIGLSWPLEIGSILPAKKWYLLGDIISQSFIDQWLDTDQVAHTPHTPIHTFLQRVFSTESCAMK